MHICIIYENLYMARKSKFDILLPDIEAFLDSYSIKAYTESRFRDIITKNLQQEDFSLTGASRKLIDYLTGKGLLVRHNFVTATTETTTVYSWKTQDEFTAISGLKNNSFFAFYTAMFLHQLTMQIPKTVYLNFERTKPSGPPVSKGSLTQDGIDLAFGGNQRKSNFSYTFHDKKIILTNGKFTNRLGVISVRNADQAYEFTDLERTLIDISVRPVYSGGVFEVMDAYRNAGERLDTKKMAVYLDQLDYLYPYHQVIGFYLEKAGFPESAYTPFLKDQTFRFYLTYNIRIKAFSEKWNLYYPQGL
jgi:hypothetical protein